MGERTGDIELAERGSAIVWFTQGWVQVRSFSGSRDTLEMCGSFDVTASGGTEQENRALAIDLAERLIISE